MFFRYINGSSILEFFILRLHSLSLGWISPSLGSGTFSGLVGTLYEGFGNLRARSGSNPEPGPPAALGHGLATHWVAAWPRAGARWGAAWTRLGRGLDAPGPRPGRAWAASGTRLGRVLAAPGPRPGHSWAAFLELSEHFFWASLSSNKINN